MLSRVLGTRRACHLTGLRSSQCIQYDIYYICLLNTNPHAWLTGCVYAAVLAATPCWLGAHDDPCHGGLCISQQHSDSGPDDPHPDLLGKEVSSAAQARRLTGALPVTYDLLRCTFHALHYCPWHPSVPSEYFLLVDNAPCRWCLCDSAHCMSLAHTCPESVSYQPSCSADACIKVIPTVTLTPCKHCSALHTAGAASAPRSS
jgi:hypothetical protein